MRRDFDLIIPLYNKEYSIEKTILTALNQEYKFNKIFVIDDGSTDNSALIVNNLIKKYHHIELIKQKNHGVSFTRNLGVQKSSAEYIVFLDADDYLSKYYLKQINVLVDKFNKKANIFSAKHSFENSDENEEQKKYSYSFSDFPLRSFLFNKNIICSSGLCLNRRIFNNFQFRNNIKIGEDIDFFLKVFSQEKLCWINNHLIFVNKTAENRSDEFWEIPFFLINKKEIFALYKSKLQKLILQFFYLKNYYSIHYKIKLFYPKYQNQFKKLVNEFNYFEKVFFSIVKTKLFEKFYKKKRI
jgi:glycosyltransferase involved in cell wall biosynthesis